MKTVFEGVKADEAAGYFQKAEVMQKDKETMQKHWSHPVVFTDAWAWGTDTDGQELPEGGTAGRIMGWTYFKSGQWAYIYLPCCRCSEFQPG